jgi:hypothetical protein
MMEDEDPEIAELQAQAFWSRRYQSHLSAHPDCRDPDHPGCSSCEGDDDD